MEYKKLIEASKRFNNNNDFNINRIILINPIDKYNFVIDQYNKDYNIIDNIVLKKVPLDKVYYYGYIMQNGIFSFILIFFVIPFPVSILNKFILKRDQYSNLIFFVFSIYFLMIFILALLNICIYINARLIYKKNVLRVRNPFMKMIFLPELCRLLNVINKHFQISESELRVFNFNESQKNKITKYEDDGKFRFMIYDQTFVDYYSELQATGLLLKHILWFLTSLGFYITYYLFIYVI